VSQGAWRFRSSLAALLRAIEEADVGLRLVSGCALPTGGATPHRPVAPRSECPAWRSAMRATCYNNLARGRLTELDTLVISLVAVIMSVTILKLSIALLPDARTRC
jgi:hypothetical protein